MRSLRERLLGPRNVPSADISVINPSSVVADKREVFVPGPFPPIATDRELGYTDAVAEALKVCEGLGIKVLAPLGAGDLTRFVYSQGWLACEGQRWRINPASTDMADLIHQALNSPDTITEKVVGESVTHHLVRAVQQIVTYGVKTS